ncbi:MAG: hypothetical protein R3B96_23210 [Pirellulaceae bacterium]
MLYVLDEPTVGLHPRDNRRLLTALRKLEQLGNTLLIVEHERDVIDEAMMSWSILGPKRDAMEDES